MQEPITRDLVCYLSRESMRTTSGSVSPRRFLSRPVALEPTVYDDRTEQREGWEAYRSIGRIGFVVRFNAL